MRATKTLFTVAIAAVAMGSLFAATSAHAAPIVLSSPPDIVSGPVTGTAVVATSKPAVWFSGTWYAPNADQTFLGSSYPAGSGSLPGDYVYRLTFDLTGLNPSTAVLTGAWTSDNASQVQLNGVGGGSIGPGAYGSTTAFSFTTGFVAGINNLDFLVNNEDSTGQVYGGPQGENPTGLHVSIFSASAEAAPVPVPEPATLALLGLGLAGLRGRLRTRTR